MVLVMVAVGLAWVGGCGDDQGDVESAGSSEGVDDELVVMTVNYPLAYFAERVGGAQVKVGFPGPADADPAFWNPPAAAIAEYQAADMILINGATYAKWLDKVTLPAGKLVDTSAGFADRYITVADAVTHAHGPGGEHAHAGTAFTTWLDFSQAAAQARAISDAFATRQPQHASAFRSNFAALEAELLAIDGELTALVAGQEDRPLMASHPVYQYLARRYGMNLQSVLWEPEVVPSEAQWEALRQRLAEHPARWMIWEGEPAEESLQRLEDMGVSSLVFAPCATRPPQGDFLAVMRANIEALAAAFD
jgi:zinc transport system substrate-binding protein